MSKLTCHLAVSIVFTTICLANFEARLLAQHTDPALSAKVDALFQHWDRPDSPGYAVAIIRDGDFLHKRGYGLANLDEGTPITSETVFDIMSASKSFSTACVALAMDQGLFAPDDDVRKYVPELRDFGATITIRHLLTCHSGLRDYWHGMIMLGRDVEDAYSNDDVFDLILRQKSLICEPGERWGYSNTDYFLLPMIIERQTHATFREFAAKHLFNPLGMKNTCFDDDRSLALRHRAVGHGHNGTVFVKHGLNNSSVGPWRLMTTLDDMLRWDSFLQKSPLPTGKYMDDFLKNGSLLGNERCLSAFPSEDYRGVRRIWYTGGGMGFMAHYIRFPGQGFSIISFGNHSTDVGWYAMEEALPQIADLYLVDAFANNTDSKTDMTAWIDDPPAVELGEDRVQELRGMVGPYRRPGGDFVELEMNDGQMCLRQISTSWYIDRLVPLTTLGEYRFRTKRGFLEFELSFDRATDTKKSAGHASTADNRRPAVHINYENGSEQRWEPVQFVSHSEEQLKEYIGEYYCDDLESVYRITSSDGQLFVEFNFGRKRLYRPTLGDSFVPVNGPYSIPIDFSRSPSGRVTGFKTGFDRTGELIFTKRT